MVGGRAGMLRSRSAGGERAEGAGLLSQEPGVRSPHALDWSHRRPRPARAASCGTTEAALSAVNVLEPPFLVSVSTSSGLHARVRHWPASLAGSGPR